MSSSRLLLLLHLFLTALIILLADISAAASHSPTASPVPTPAPSPKKKKTTPILVPVASPTFSPSASPPVPDYSAPGPSTTDAGTDCMTLLFGAVDCLTYVEEGSNLTVPDKACCPELATLVNTNPICLCQLLKKGNSFGIAIDMSRALTLPSACKVDTPDPGLCALVNGSPTGAPGPSPSDGLPPTEAGVPPTSVNNDNGVAVVAPTSSLLVLVVAFAAIYMEYVLKEF